MPYRFQPVFDELEAVKAENATLREQLEFVTGTMAAMEEVEDQLRGDIAAGAALVTKWMDKYNEREEQLTAANAHVGELLKTLDIIKDNRENDTGICEEYCGECSYCLAKDALNSTPTESLARLRNLEELLKGALVNCKACMGECSQCSLFEPVDALKGEA